MMIYYVYRIALDDEAKLVWMTDDRDEALMVRDTCYKALEQERKNGEMIQNYRYIVIQDMH